MDFRLTDDQQSFRDALRRFCDEQIAPQAEWRDHHGRFEDGLREKVAEMGLFGVYVPEEYGGAGLDIPSYVTAVEEVSRACGATGILMSAHHSLCVDPILSFGSDAQKQQYLPKLASGEWIGCFSLTEPGSGSDAGGARCMAVEKPDGWHITGTKCFVTNGSEAHVVILFAVTDGLSEPPAPSGGPSSGPRPQGSGPGGKRRMTAFIIDRDMPGWRTGKVEKKMGIKASSTTELIFEDCIVPKANQLGERGKGLKVALSTLDGGRLGVAAQAIGIAQAALDAAAGYSRTRHQFNRPIADFQAIQWKLADMHTALAAARLLCRRGAWLKQRAMELKHGATDAKRQSSDPLSPTGERAGVRGGGESAPSYEAEAAMAKLFASEASSRVTNMAVQVFGGYGYICDYPVERYLRDAKITELYEGTSEIQRLVIARKVLTE